MISDWPLDGPGWEDAVEVHEPGEPVITGYASQWVSERYYGGPYYVVVGDDGGHYEVHPHHLLVVSGR